MADLPSGGTNSYDCTEYFWCNTLQVGILVHRAISSHLKASKMGIHFDHPDFALSGFRPMSVSDLSRIAEKRLAPVSRQSLVQIDITQEGKLEIRIRDCVDRFKSEELQQVVNRTLSKEYIDVLMRHPTVQHWVASQCTNLLAGRSFSAGSDTEEDEPRPVMMLPSRPQVITHGSSMQPIQPNLDLTPTKRKRYDSEQPLTEVPTYGETQATTRSASISLKVSDDDAVQKWYRAKFAEIQQSICKFIAKDWIKVVEPRKQSNFPYKNRNDSAPGWWPEGVVHIEPDHLKKDQRLKLLVTLIELPQADPHAFEAATSANKDLQLEEPKHTILKDIYKVARARKIFKDDPSNKWNARQAVTVAPAVEKSADKSKTSIKRPKRESTTPSRGSNWFSSSMGMSDSSFSMDEPRPQVSNPFLMSASMTAAMPTPTSQNELHPPYSLQYAFPDQHPAFPMQHQHDLTHATQAEMFHPGLGHARAQVWHPPINDSALGFARWNESFPAQTTHVGANGMHFGHNHMHGGHLTPSSAGSGFELADLKGVSPVTSIDTVATTHSMARDQSFSTLLDGSDGLIVPDVSCDGSLMGRTASIHDLNGDVSFQPMGPRLD